MFSMKFMELSQPDIIWNSLPYQLYLKASDQIRSPKEQACMAHVNILSQSECLCSYYPRQKRISIPKSILMLPPNQYIFHQVYFLVWPLFSFSALKLSIQVLWISFLLLKKPLLLCCSFDHSIYFSSLWVFLNFYLLFFLQILYCEVTTCGFYSFVLSCFQEAL